MSENDELARRLAEEQARADKEALDEVTQKIEAGFRLASQEQRQRQAAHRNQEAPAPQQRQEQEQETALAQVHEYEAENMQKAQEAGKDIAGDVQQSFNHTDNTQTTGTSYTSDDNTNQDDVTMPAYEGLTIQEGDQTTTDSADMDGQTDAYDLSIQNINRDMHEDLRTDLQTIPNAERDTNENLGIAPFAETSQYDANVAPNQEADATAQTEVDYNDPFAAWHAENQMRTATLDMNQSEQAMLDEQFNTVTPDSYSVGAQESAKMGLYTQDLSNDDRVLYKTIRTANSDEYDPIKVGPQPLTQTANTLEKTAPDNAQTDDPGNRIYVNDQTFASRFADTPFWKSDERKKAWDQFVNGFKNAKTLEDLIENGLWASLEIGLDMINAYMDWENAEAKKLGSFIKEAKKTYDAEQNKANGISPMEAAKRTHDGIHASKGFWNAFEQQKFYGDLPKNEWGGIDLKNCTNEQKAMMGEFQVRFAQSSPDFKRTMENMMGREFNAEDLMLAAESVRNTLYGFEDGSKRINEAQNTQGPSGYGPTGPQQNGPDAPAPQAPTPDKPLPQGPAFDKTMPQGPALKSEMPRSTSPENTAGLLNNAAAQTVATPNRTPENHTPEALENKDTPNVYRMGPLFQEKKPDVIDGRTGEILEGFEAPDKETMRDVTPPKGPLKNARPTEFGDLSRRASDNIKDMHSTTDAMRQNKLNARLIEASRTGDRPTPNTHSQNKMLGNDFGRGAAA